MTGSVQQQWAFDQLDQSKARGAQWRLIMQQVVFGTVNYTRATNGSTGAPRRRRAVLISQSSTLMPVRLRRQLDQAEGQGTATARSANGSSASASDAGRPSLNCAASLTTMSACTLRFSADAADHQRHRALRRLTRKLGQRNPTELVQSVGELCAVVCCPADRADDPSTGAGSVAVEFAGSAVSSPSSYGSRLNATQYKAVASTLVSSNPALQYAEGQVRDRANRPR